MLLCYCKTMNEETMIVSSTVFYTLRVLVTVTQSNDDELRKAQRKLQCFPQN